MCRKYWLRLIYLSFIISIISMSLLSFTIMFKSRKLGSFSSFSDHREYVNVKMASSTIQPISIPSKYIIVPYREFVLRTSMSCRMFKLDNPRKTLKALHPMDSPYLRGSFQPVIPSTNITYDDIHNFYMRVLVKKRTSTIQASYAKNIGFDYIPYVFQNGMWHPIGIVSIQRTAVLVTLQGREYNVKTFLFNMHAFLRRQLLTYTIVIIEQVLPNNRFNKGRLYNAGVNYLEKQGLNISCIILHDVDLIPENDNNFYTCESKHAKHTTVRIRELNSTVGYRKYYDFLVGGVLLLTFDMYRNLNGFSNLYWGWGGEDDDLALRFLGKGMCVVRPSYESAVYIALPHPHVQRNPGRFSLLTWAALRSSVDGFNQIESITNIVAINKTPVATYLKLNVNVN